MNISVQAKEQTILNDSDFETTLSEEVFVQSYTELFAVHYTKPKYDKKQKDPIITINKNFLVEPKKIGDTEFYSEGSLSSERARIYAKQLLDIYKITDKIQICVENRDE